MKISRLFRLAYCFASFSIVFASGLTVAQQTTNSSSKNALPEIGVVASEAISLDKEQQVGEVLMKQMRAQAPLIHDPLLEEYIQDLGNRLVAQAQNVKFPYTFFLINNQDINAFAFFGGHIGIHTGLINHASNESELASVLAHEVSHVTQRHIARSIQARQRSSTLQLASFFGGILLALADPEAGMAALQASSAASAQSQINYTRSNEKEADSIGIQILAQAGFNPQGAASFFGKLAEQNRTRSRPLAFLLTHPLPESRIAEARTRAGSLPNRGKLDSLNFQLAKARIQARYYGNAKNNIRYFQNQLDKQRYRYKQAADYGLALSYMANEQYEKAQTIIKSLMDEDPENLFYLDVFTDLSIELKQTDKAIVKLEERNERMPHNQVITLNLANALISKKDFAQGTSILKDFLLVHPNHFLALQLLSDAYGENQQMLEMHQSKAELFAQVGAYQRAIDELHSAYNFAHDRKLEKQRIRARINQFRDAQNRLKNL